MLRYFLFGFVAGLTAYILLPQIPQFPNHAHDAAYILGGLVGGLTLCVTIFVLRYK